MGGQSLKCPDCDDWFLGRQSLWAHMKAKHPIVPMVLNVADYGHGLPPNTTYCGRGSFAGNPYRIGIDGTRDEVIDRYIAEKSQDEPFLERVRRELKGRNLACHCHPKRCHCDWLICVANP